MPCSTPFGITELDTAASDAAWPAGVSAQRLSASLNSTHLALSRIAAAERRCSTPFGITELDTRRRPPGRRPPTGAQRLSASLNSTRSSRSRGRPRARCSTPFGITELDTQPVH